MKIVKVVFAEILEELKKNFWLWAAVASYSFWEKEIALAWILYGIYFKVTEVLAAVEARNAAPCFTFTLNDPSVKVVTEDSSGS